MASKPHVEIILHPRKAQKKPLRVSSSSLRRATNGSPEVVLKITRGGKTPGHARAHLAYLTRHGRLEALNEHGEEIADKDELKSLLARWRMDEDPGAGRLKAVHHMIFSMPKDTDPQKLLEAVQAFAAREFAPNHPYVMVLHEPKTDPRHTSAEHPHVHVMVRVRGRNGVRLNPSAYVSAERPRVNNQPTLAEWRELYAQLLRDRGIDANATPRAVRGVAKFPKKREQFNLEKRTLEQLEATLNGTDAPAGTSSRFVEQLLQDLQHGGRAARKVVARAADDVLIERREAMVEALRSLADELAQQREPDFAKEIRAYADRFPSVKTSQQILIDRLQPIVEHLRLEGGTSRQARPATER